MRIIISIILFLFLSLLSYSQDINQIYLSGDLDLAISAADECLKLDQNNIDCNLIMGRALADKGKYQEAIPYLNFTVTNDTKNTWRKAWALAYLGTCYFQVPDYTSSKMCLNECIKLKVTKNVTTYADQILKVFGFDNFFNKWKTVETNNFRFHFQNMDDVDIKHFTSSHESGFQKINAFFESTLPKKIDFFVWNSHKDAKKLLQRDLGFAYPNYSIVHSYYQQTIGHEMTHVISYFTTDILFNSRFINEGTAVCFDLSNRNGLEQVHNWIKRNNRKINIMDIWENDISYDEDVLYPIAGLFVDELIKYFGKDKFLEFFKDQSYRNAKLIFGNELDLMIEKFESNLNIP